MNHLNKQTLTAAVKTTPTHTKWFNLDCIDPAVWSKHRPGDAVDTGCASSCVCLCIWQMGSLKNVTVLFLHSNKLESLPEEMGDMQKLKVINLSDNKYVPLCRFTRPTIISHNSLQRMLKHHLLISTNNLTFIQNDYLFQVMLLIKLLHCFDPRTRIFLYKCLTKLTNSCHSSRLKSFSDKRFQSGHAAGGREPLLWHFSERTIWLWFSRLENIAAFSALCAIFISLDAYYARLFLNLLFLLNHVPFFILVQHTIILTCFYFVIQ